MYETCSPVMYQLRVRTTGASLAIAFKITVVGSHHQWL